MIYVEERSTKKLPGLTSLFVNFDYNPAIIEILKTFQFNYDKDSKEWEISIAQLDDLLYQLSEVDEINCKFLKEKELKKEKKINTELCKTKPFSYQEEGINFGLNHDKWLLLDSPGLGKCTSLGTPILTPTGWKKMRDIEVGDTVYDVEGQPCKVTATYLNRMVDMYKITFSDGASIECCKDHLWQIDYRKTVYSGVQKSKTKKMTTAVKNTQWLYEHNYKDSQAHIPLISNPVDFEKKELPVHPYLLGCLLGDGCMSSGYNVSLTSADDHIINKVSDLLPAGCVLRKVVKPGNKAADYRISVPGTSSSNPLVKQLRELGLMGTSSKTKFIPDIYKFSSIEDRLDLLRGLLDTGGYAGKESPGRNGKLYGNLLQFDTVSERLYKDFIEVVESLGGLCKRRSPQKAHYFNEKLQKRVECNPRYNCTIQIEDPTQLVTLPRKLERLRPRKLKPRRLITNIVPIPPADGKCITVDSPSHLYVAEHYIVTHNTLQTILLAEELKRIEDAKHCLIVCGVNMLKSNWQQEIEKHSNLSSVVIGLKYNKKGRMITTSVSERIEQLKSKIDDYFVIINIEMLRNKEVVKVLCNKKYNQYDIVVCDEIHKCKDPSAEQTKGLLKLKAKHTIGLTGTLLLNDPVDAYMPMKWIGEEKSSLGRFKSTYYSYGGLFGNEVVGYRNLDYLRYCLSKCSLRRPKDILGLDKKNIIVEHLDMNDIHQTFYNNIVKGVVEEADKVDLMPANILSMVTRLRQATSCPSILTSQSNVSSTKIDRAVELCDSIISSGEKAVIFSMYKETVYELQKRLGKYKPVIGTGDLSTEEIEKNKDLFQNNPDTKVFIGTFAKMSTGITLTAASYMICIDSNWTQADNTQAEDRIYRIGTKGSVFIYYLVCKNTIDEKVLEIVNNKSIVSDFVVDNKINPQMYTQLKTIITDLQE